LRLDFFVGLCVPELSAPPSGTGKGTTRCPNKNNTLPAIKTNVARNKKQHVARDKKTTRCPQ
jgi:hypothetical protein